MKPKTFPGGLHPPDNKEWTARKAIEIHGSYGIMHEYPVQRLLRDALVTIPAGGTAEIAKIVLSRQAMTVAG